MRYIGRSGGGYGWGEIYYDSETGKCYEESYHCGWWTEIGTEATTKALKEFLQCTETQLEQMGKNGRKLIEEKYSSQKVAQDMVELYKKVCL